MRFLLILLLSSTCVFAQVKINGVIQNTKISAEHFIDEDIVLYWPLWGDANDKANHYNGTTTGVTYITGHNDKNCAVLEPANFANIYNSDISSDLFGNGYSLSILINPSDLGTSTGYRYLFSSDNHSISAKFDSSSTGLIRCGLSISTGYGSAINTKYLKPDISANNWHKYTESYHNNIFEVCIDNNAVYRLDCRPYKKSIEFETTSLAIQGVCSDGDYIYTTDAGYLDKFDLEGNKLNSVQTGATLGHTGDCCVVGDHVYIPYVYPSWSGSETGIAKFNKSDLSIDLSFGNNGKIILSDDLPDNDASALCWNGSNFYLLGYTDKVYCYNSDFTELTATYTVDTNIVSIRGNDEQGDYAHVGDGITYDRVKERFFITFHGYLAFTIDKNFDNDSIVYAIPQTSDGKINCQGVEWLNTNTDGQETILIGNRDIGTENNGVMKMTREPNSIKRPLHNLWLFWIKLDIISSK